MNKFLIVLTCIFLSINCLAKGGVANSANFKTMVDPRDGQEYKTVTIGKQTWMAENLNYETTDSYCYDDYMSNCVKYGRLYEWEKALTVCPAGWHLPSLQEWETLFESVGGLASAGNALKFAKGWDSYGSGIDAYGFGALPAGGRSDSGIYNSKLLYAGFWSSTDVISSLAYSLLMGHDFRKVRYYEGLKKYGYSVRCLKGKAKKNPKNGEKTVYFRGLLKDSRDGKMYKTVRIGEQIWMAENLNYDADESVCYKNSLGNCQKYGRLYTWSVAKNICPTGYHLPSLDEWRILFETLGGQMAAGKHLKSKTGWLDGGVGTDDYGFSALPAGKSGGLEGEQAFFWSFADYRNETAYYMTLKNHSGVAYLLDDNENSKFSVRCVMDRRKSKGVIQAPMSKLGCFKDSRDGKTYKTTKIGNQVWMAENLDYKVDDSYCYKDSLEYCKKYGRLYTWAAAMDSVGAFSTNSKGCGYKKVCAPIYPVQGVCPAGWHLPTLTEWKELINFAGGNGFNAYKLKSNTVWKNEGSDDYGFSAYPAGYRSDDRSYYYGNAHFWSSTEDSKYSGNYVVLEEEAIYGSSSDLYVARGYNSKPEARSVRCVRNQTKDERKGKMSDCDCSKCAEKVYPDSISSVSADSIGSITDSRDGQTYKAVKIGSQIWMAENLNYETANSFCYQDALDSCKVYGRLYTWATAMDSVGLFSTNAKNCGDDKHCSPTFPVRGICPEGFHLPDTTEWKTLLKSAGGKYGAGKKLKSETHWGVKGSDEYGFSILPARGKSDGGWFLHDRSTYFWSSIEYGSYSAYTNAFYESESYDYHEFSLQHKNKGYAFSVRCVRD